MKMIYVPTHLDSEEMKWYLLGMNEIKKRRDFDRLVEWLEEHRFFELPAGLKHHGTNDGDLLRHSLAVARRLKEFSDVGVMQWKDPASSPLVVGLLHDVCKAENYMRVEGGGFCWNPNSRSGHGLLSLLILDEIGFELTDEERLCIRWHMGAYEGKDVWQDIHNAIVAFPAVQWTHHADMLAAKLDA